MYLKRAQVKILENRRIVNNYFKLSFKTQWIAKAAKPGQFIQIRVGGGFEPLLRKPFGIHRVRESSIIEVLYEVVGKGTKILSRRKAGEYLDVIGPLGNGFSYQYPVSSIQYPVLVAGGIGAAPLTFLAQKLKNGKPIVLIGAKAKRDILCEKEFKNLGCEVKIATDDGSKGYRGFVTNLLKTFLSSIQYSVSSIYACGPRSMLTEMAHIVARYKIPCQVLLEEYMACGIGVCLGCPVMTKDGYKMVCKDGPVFEAGEVVWE